MKYLDFIVVLLLVVGGLNWGFVGAFDFNFVTYFFGGTAFEKVTYVLVGLSAVWYGLKFFGISDKLGVG